MEEHLLGAGRPAPPSEDRQCGTREQRPLIAGAQTLEQTRRTQRDERAGIGDQAHWLANVDTALPYRPPRVTEVMRKSKFVTVTIWVVVIGMVLSLSFAVVGLFQ